MAINKLKTKEFNPLGLMLGIGTSLATGNPLPAAASIASEASPDSPVGGIIGMADSFNSIGNKSTDLGRRLEQQKQDPSYIISNGLKQLDHPDIIKSMSPEDYMSTAETLLRAQHYGYGGGLS